MKDRTVLLGAYDRFNYGDLLFPIILGDYFSKIDPVRKVDVHGYIESNLSSYGALPTKSFRSLLSPGYMGTGSSIILAGGGLLGATWTGLYRDLLGPMQNQMISKLVRVFGRPRVDKLVQRRFGSPSFYPCIFEPRDFSASPKIIYNAVGGSQLARSDERHRNLMLQKLASGSFVSVRDAETKRLLHPIEDANPVHLAPDSASIMSDLYPIPELNRRVTKSFDEKLLASGDYFCFQCLREFAIQYGDVLANQIDAIHKKTGLKVVLLPIGRCYGLRDDVAAEIISSKISAPHFVVSDKSSIWEVMATISRSRLFVGTSLHGNITAQSFSVPHIGISTQIGKLDYYLETWDLDEQSRCVGPDGIAAKADEVLAIGSQRLDAKAKELIGKSYENFELVSRAAGIA